MSFTYSSASICAAQKFSFWRKDEVCSQLHFSNNSVAISAVCAHALSQSRHTPLMSRPSWQFWKAQYSLFNDVQYMSALMVHPWSKESIKRCFPVLTNASHDFYIYKFGYHTSCILVKSTITTATKKKNPYQISNAYNSTMVIDINKLSIPLCRARMKASNCMHHILCQCCYQLLCVPLKGGMIEHTRSTSDLCSG